MFCILRLWLLNFFNFVSHSHISLVNVQSTTLSLGVMHLWFCKLNEWFICCWCECGYTVLWSTCSVVIWEFNMACCTLKSSTLCYVIAFRPISKAAHSWSYDKWCYVYTGLSHLAALQQFEALLAIPGIVPKMVTVSLLHSMSLLLDCICHMAIMAIVHLLRKQLQTVCLL